MKMRLFFCLGLITLLLVCGIADATPVLTFQWSVPSTVGIKGAQHAAVDNSGNVYVTDTGNQSVWKFASDGTLITKWGAPGTDDGQFNNPSYITVNQSGYVYVVDDGNTRIEEFTSDGTYVRQWGSSGSDPGQFHSITGIATDPNGNVSVVDNRYWGSEQNRVEIFDPSGTFLMQFGSNGGGSGTFTNPHGIAADASGDWYVVDSNLQLVQQFYNNGTYRGQWGNPGTPGSDHGQFKFPSDIAIDASGNISVLDSENYRVEKFHSDMSYSETYSLETTDYSPTGLGVAGDGSVYVTISGAVRKYSSAGTLLFTNNAAGSGNGEFNQPSGIAVNATGYIYVTDTLNNRTQRFDPNGVYLSQWGSPGSGNGQFSNPKGIATDTSGKVYIVDVGNRRIQVFDPSGNYVDQWPITATYTNHWVGADHIAFDPLVIAVDPDGNIYVGERCYGWGVGQIEKFDSGHTSINITSTGWGVPDGGDPTPTGITVGPDGFLYASIAYAYIDKYYSNGTFVAVLGPPGTGNGQLSGPTGVAVNGEGFVYGIDHGNRIQLFDPQGNYWLTWGSYGTGNGQFDYTAGIATDTSGNIYIIDQGNERIQKFLRSGTSTIVPVPQFSSQVTAGPIPFTVKFTDTSIGVPASWSWDFGDANTTNATLKNPVHTYSTPGKYSVTLSATNADGTNATTKTDYIWAMYPIPNTTWQRSLGGSSSDGAKKILQTTDGGYILAGYSYSNDGDVTANYGNDDYWIVKLDSSGAITWQKSLGGSGYDEAKSIAQTSDGGYIVAGASKSTDGNVTGNHGDYDAWVVKLDSAGTITWQKSYGGLSSDGANKIIQASDGGYIFAGYSNSNDGNVTGNHGNGDYWVVKLDSAGAITWQKSLGGSGDDSANDIIQTSDEGYIVAGYSESNNGDVSGNHGNGDYWIVKLNSSGAITWQKSLGGSSHDNAYSIAQTSDGGYIVAGWTNSNDGNVTTNHGDRDCWVVKLTSSGAITWQKSLGSSAGDEVYSVAQTSDGGYILAGYSASNDGDVTVNYGMDDYWIIKLDSSGTISWQKSFGGSSYDDAYSIAQTSDGGYIVAGQSASSDGDIAHPLGDSDYWILKLGGSSGGGTSAPVASFTANVTSGTAPLTVGFTDTSTNTPTAWTWSFRNVSGNNTQVWWSTDQNASHTFGTGTYAILLNASNSLGYNFSTQVTFVNVTTAIPPANGTVINQSATLFIGEEGLNVTHALNQAAGTPNINGEPYFTTIGWWSSPTLIGTTSPNVTVELSGRYKSLLVDPDTFVGRTGDWYLLDSHWDPITPAIFTVADPSVDVRVWDFDHTTDVTGSSIAHGTRLGFRIDTNLYQMTNARSPLNYATDGFIDISVKNESGITITTLYNDSTSAGVARAGPHSLLANYVNTQPFYWGASSGYSWATSALNGSTNIYPPGTYTVTATSTLHNMLSNYRTTGGAAYTGKTISPARTVILASKPAPVVSFTEDVTNGTVPFTVQFTGSAAETPTAWNWSFGDGNYSAVQSPSYTFVLPKVHNVTLTATFSSILSNSTMQQITAYAQKVATTSAVNGTTSSTVAGNQTMIVNTSAITETGGTVTTSGNTITITGANSFWQSTQIQAASVATNETPGNVTVANVTQVVMQSAPVTATLNQTFSNVSVSLDVALKQYVPDADVNIAITQGATTDTTHAFQLAAQNASKSISDIAYTVQFSNTELINSNLTTSAARTSTAVVLNMSVNHTWVVHFDTGSNNYGRDAIAIIRYPEAGNPQSLPTRFIVYDPTTNLDWFNSDSKDGLSIFGMVGYAAQQAAAQQAAPPSGSLVRSTPQAIDTANPNTIAPDKTQNKPTAASTPAPTKPPAPPVPAYMTSAPLKNDKTGKLSAPVQVKAADSAALLSLPQGTKPTDSAGHTISEVSINTMDSSSIPSPESPTYSFSGLAYQCSPDGAQFNPPITISFSPSEDQWSSLISSGSQPVICTYSPATGSWTSLPSTTDTSSHTVSAPVSHFSTYALFSEPASSSGTPASPSSSPVSAPSATPKPNAKPPANALEIIINLSSWCLEVISKNLFLSLAAITAVILASVGWSRHRRKKRFDAIMYKR